MKGKSLLTIIMLLSTIAILAPQAKVHAQSSYYAGANFSNLGVQNGTTAYTGMQIPNGTEGVGHGCAVLLSLFDSSGSYDQLGFVDGTCGIIYSWTDNNGYHGNLTGFLLTLGRAYTFNITAKNGFTYFAVYQGTTKIWSQSIQTGANYLIISGTWQWGIGPYTVYEEYPEGYPVPILDFYLYNSYWVATNGTTYAATWDLFEITTDNIPLYISNNAILIDNTGTISPQPLPISAIKTRTDGYCYIPCAFPMGYLRIEKLFDNQQLVGDEHGGVSPYPSIADWPDGNVTLADLVVLSNAYGSNESPPIGPHPWNYMADIVPDKAVNLIDQVALAANYGYTGGTYMTDLTNVTVTFNNNATLAFNPDADGFIEIPSPITNQTSPMNFTVTRNNITIGALVTFWAP